MKSPTNKGIWQYFWNTLNYKKCACDKWWMIMVEYCYWKWNSLWPRLSVGQSVGLLVGWSAIISEKGGKFTCWNTLRILYEVLNVIKLLYLPVVFSFNAASKLKFQHWNQCNKILLNFKFLNYQIIKAFNLLIIPDRKSFPKHKSKNNELIRLIHILYNFN